METKLAGMMDVVFAVIVVGALGCAVVAGLVAHLARNYLVSVVEDFARQK